MLNALVRQAIQDIPNNKMADVRLKFMDRLSALLASYRSNCAKTQSIGQLILPEPLRLLPVYSLGYRICKKKQNLIFSGY
jgi:hypothetical protein